MYKPNLKRIKKHLFILFCLLIFLVINQVFETRQEIFQENQEFTKITETNETTESTSTAEKQLSKKTYLVKRVIDGDTIELDDGTKVRYIGIDTPETVAPNKQVECFGKEASSFNKNLVENKEIILEADISEIDKYGRLLRYVYIDDIFVNEYLVREGYAYAVSFPPDVKYQHVFENAQSYAKSNNKGLWSMCKDW